MSEALVIIGNGMAAARLVEELSKKALGRYAIAIIGEEPRLAYNRVLLSSVLSGDIDKNDIDLKPAEWWRDHGVTLRYGCKASAIDLAATKRKIGGRKKRSLQQTRHRDRFSRLAAAPPWRASLPECTPFAMSRTSRSWRVSAPIAKELS